MLALLAATGQAFRFRPGTMSVARAGVRAGSVSMSTVDRTKALAPLVPGQRLRQAEFHGATRRCHAVHAPN